MEYKEYLLRRIDNLADKTTWSYKNNRDAEFSHAWLLTTGKFL